MPDRWLVRVDVGGTFTDCVAEDPDGRRHVAKVLSDGTVRGEVAACEGRRITLAGEGWDERVAPLEGAEIRPLGGGDPARVASVDPPTAFLVLDADVNLAPGDRLSFSTGEPAPILAARLVTRTPAAEPLPPCEFRLATTRATNALLTRQHARCALFVTEGFADVLRIGNQQRPNVYARCVVKPATVTELTFGVPGRVGPDGSVVVPLGERQLRAACADALAAGAETAAVCMVGAWADDSIERRAAEICRECGFRVVVTSAELTPRIGLLARARAATIEAALEPVLGAYLREVRAPLGESPLAVLTSAGGLVEADAFRPVDGLLSGPAGGVVGAAAVGRACAAPRVISFDMGGTSTDVARLDLRAGAGRERTPTHTIGGVTIARPAVAIETVAAGGGSICSVKEGRLSVGPESAGAAPGPACYGAGGPLTITDVNLLLGRIGEEAFEIPIDTGAAERALARLAEQLGAAGERMSRADLLAGLLELANERMAEAIRSVSIRRGYDPAAHTMVAFGGAGPQHACEVAARLGIRTVLVPEHASLLSAVGLDAAAPEAIAERTLLIPLEGNEDRIEQTLAELSAEAVARLAHQTPRIVRTARLRLAGQEAALEVDASDVAVLGERFATAYEREHAARPERAVEVVAVTALATAEDASPSTTVGRAVGHASSAAARSAANGRIARADLRPGSPLLGPLVVTEPRTQTWVPAGWVCDRDRGGTLRLTVHEERASKATPSRPVALAREVIVHRLASIAGQMGDALERAAVSVNVKDRRDYSCAVHDPEGRLVASADHMPVHLGALGPCVRAVLETMGPLDAGEAALTNHPAFGGSHLPDLTLVQPVFAVSGERLGYVASRAHHAEIGGLTPGSMPPDARCLADEGVPIAPMLAARGGLLLESDLRRVLSGHRLPTRAIDDNLADLGAAVSAGTRAAALVAALAEEEGVGPVLDAMNWINAHTAELVRAKLAALSGLDEEVEERMDGGAIIRARLRVAADGDLLVDFTGSSPTRPNSVNAPLAVTRAVVAYVLRLVLDQPIALNDGFLEPVEVRVPQGCFLNPRFEADPEASPPVAAGNVETSQRLTEALLRGFGLGAGGAGTMNNTLLGNARFGVYETLGSGCGASAAGAGADGVHQHMSNTAITDAEALERRYPLRVRRFEIRRGSGGAGSHRGGDGLLREIEALEPITASLITQRREAGAPGANGGEAGEPGRNTLVPAGGAEKTLSWAATAELHAGDVVRIETPGGGGWGNPPTSPA